MSGRMRGLSVEDIVELVEAKFPSAEIKVHSNNAPSPRVPTLISINTKRESKVHVHSYLDRLVIPEDIALEVY